jgi:hypothetical protein
MHPTSSNLPPVEPLSVVCQRCHIQPAQGDDELCSNCRQRTRYAHPVQRGIRAVMGWTAACIFDGLLGIGAATALVMPFAYVSASPPPSLHDPRTWFIGLAVLIVIALLVGAVQSKETGATAHVERSNNTLRQRLGRFVRKTLSFSKSLVMHEIALRFFLHRYNLEIAILRG